MESNTSERPMECSDLRKTNRAVWIWAVVFLGLLDTVGGIGDKSESHPDDINSLQQFPYRPKQPQDNPK